MQCLAVAAAVASLAIATARGAAAQSYPPITDRDHALDVAGAAVRRTTQPGTFGWDFHVDGASAAFADDFDNHGLDDTDDAASPIASLGLVLQYGTWGIGLVGVTSSTQIVEETGDATTMDGVIEPQGSVGKLVIAGSFLDEAHTVGLGLRVGSLSVVQPRTGFDDVTLFTISGPGLETGWVWRPPERSWRVGANAALPVRGLTKITVDDCNPHDCEGYILPERVEVPWVAAVGGAYRFAPTPWNTDVDTPYRDERALLLAADVVVNGMAEDGHGLEAFTRHMLQPSGRRTSVSLRLGAELEAIPGWLRLRAGSYWEPGRFDDVGGRLHGTAGADIRLFELHLFGQGYRPQLSFTADRARDYGNLGASVGFWR